MLTTKVVSNKKPPLLSDSESGGSTSLIGKNLYIEPESLFKYLFNKRYYSIGEDNNKDIIYLE